MKDVLTDYMSNRLSEINVANLKTKPGPVITISRLAGCSSQKLASELANRLNALSNDNKWTVLSKEVLKESAEQLKLKPKNIKTVFKTKDRTVLEDVMQAFLSKEYHLERKMRNTVINVIRKFSVEGHKIILGRGANIIGKDIEDSLHIRFVGPIDWRINQVMKSKKYSKEQALHCILETEKDRENFRKSIKGKKIDSEDFDLTINQSKFSTEQIIELIITALKNKKII